MQSDEDEDEEMEPGILTVDALEAYGFLGPPPRVILDGPPQVVKSWKQLASEAKRIAKMPLSRSKISQAKWVEKRRRSIIEWAETGGKRGLL